MSNSDDGGRDDRGNDDDHSYMVRRVREALDEAVEPKDIVALTRLLKQLLGY